MISNQCPTIHGYNYQVFCQAIYLDELMHTLSNALLHDKKSQSNWLAGGWFSWVRSFSLLPRRSVAR